MPVIRLVITWFRRSPAWNFRVGSRKSLLVRRAETRWRISWNIVESATRIHKQLHPLHQPVCQPGSQRSFPTKRNFGETGKLGILNFPIFFEREFMKEERKSDANTSRNVEVRRNLSKILVISVEITNKVFRLLQASNEKDNTNK